MKHLLTIQAVVAVTLLILPGAGAKQLLNRKNALKEVLGTSDVNEVEKSIAFDKADAIAEQLKKEAGRRLPRGHRIRVRPGATYFFPAGQKNEDVAVIIKEPGKWGPIQFIVGMDPATGKIKDVAVMSYSEKRGRPIARNNFLRQFNGNEVDEPIIVGRGLRGISGATVSSWAAALAVRKAQLHYKEAFLTGRE